FFLGPVALAAIGAGVVAALGVGVVGQLLVFIGGSVASVLFLRPIARRHLHMPAALRTGTAALEGTKAVVLQRVDVHGGRARLGRYSRPITPVLAIVVPYVDRVRDMMDLREQVVSFEPQPVITEDNLVVSIDTVIYFQVTDAKAATYEIANYIQGIEQLTVTT